MGGSTPPQNAWGGAPPAAQPPSTVMLTPDVARARLAEMKPRPGAPPAYGPPAQAAASAAGSKKLTSQQLLKRILIGAGAVIVLSTIIAIAVSGDKKKKGGRSGGDDDNSPADVIDALNEAADDEDPNTFAAQFEETGEAVGQLYQLMAYGGLRLEVVDTDVDDDDATVDVRSSAYGQPVGQDRVRMRRRRGRWQISP